MLIETIIKTMRLTQKKIEQILTGMLGDDGLPLIRELLTRNNVSEFDLASKTKKDIKVIRKMLYILYNHNLVEFTRKKDKIKGWYIYYWTLLPESVRFDYFKGKRDLLERLKEQLEHERKELFFVCPAKCVRLNFDQAMDFEFHCPECGELIGQDNNEQRIAYITQKILETEKELEQLKVQRKVKRKIVQEKKKIRKLKKKKQQKDIKPKKNKSRTKSDVKK